ncbi:MAG: histidine--tRNA ligase, partial [Alistipes sp.]|nr:histidine--tRNA ligase [Alistipes sp.]
GLDLFPQSVDCSTQVLFANLGEAEEEASLRLLATLRDAGVAAEIYPESAKMKKQMEYADRRNIPFVVIIGSRELETRCATVKNMQTGEQREVAFDGIAGVFKA